MKIIELLANKDKNLNTTKMPTIAFLGDSVTQGCFEFYKKTPDDFETIFDKEHAYHKYLTDILNHIFPTATFNIINAGISGGNTVGAVKRLERDVLCHNPNLTVVCFGLNDTTDPNITKEMYADNLRTIFTKLQEVGSEVIFMTPNMMCTYAEYRIGYEHLYKTAETNSKIQNEGALEEYLIAGKTVAKDCGVAICDVYAKWKALYNSGANTTLLLSNYINHPTREMNMLFATSLFDTMIMD